MNTTTPFVSVVLPFYKAGDEFIQAIESIRNQTFTAWELLLVNNNAPSYASSIVHYYTSMDSRILHFHENHQGIAHALNKGLKHSRGRYIARMDADDYSLADRLQKQYNFRESRKAIDVVASQTRFHSGLEKSHGYELFVQWQNSILIPDQHNLYRFIESPVAHPSVMFRRNLIDLYGLYTLENVPEDYELWLRWMDHGVLINKLDEPLLQWNDHHGRLSRQHKNYSVEAFFTVKSHYLARWLKKFVPKDKKIVVCGSSKTARRRAAMLSDKGVDVFGFTDVKKRHGLPVHFIPYEQIKEPGAWFLINLIATRGVGQQIRAFFSGRGFVEGKDFILAA